MPKESTALCKGHCGLHYTQDKLLDGLCITCLHDGLKDSIEELQDTIKEQNESINELRTTVNLKYCPTGLTIRRRNCVYHVSVAGTEEGILVRAVTRNGLLQSLVILPKTENVIRLILRGV